MGAYEEEFEILDEDEESGLQVDISKFSDAVIWGTDWTTETIAAQLEKGNIDLNPSFQRRDAWSNGEKSKLIESLMLAIPVPPIILAENKSKRNSYIVIDGKQRLLSIRRFFSTATTDECNKDINLFKPLRLSQLDILKQLDGKTYTDLKNEDNEYLTNLENQPIRTIVIKNWPDEDFLYTVFLRLNTGSKKLSPQELRQALKPGPFLTYLEDATANSDTIKRMMNNTRPDSRMRDVELALRYFAFKNEAEKYDGRLKEFLDSTCEHMNRQWLEKDSDIKKSFTELEEAIKFSYQIFPNNPFSRYTNGNCHRRFSKPIFGIFSYYFSEPQIREALRPHISQFRDLFVALNDNQEFVSAVSNTTKDPEKVFVRYNKMLGILQVILKDTHIEVNSIVHNLPCLKVEKTIL